MSVVVLGTGLAELSAAYEFARFGVPVTVIDQAAETPVIPRGSQSDPDGILEEWITAVAHPLRDDTLPEAEPVYVPPGAQWVRRADRWVQIPDGSVYGIPPSPLSQQMLDALGNAAAFRAYLDRITPVLTIGKAQFVSELVRKRLGSRVLDTFVDPLVRHLFGRATSDVEVSQLAPGLNETHTRAGSLTGAALAYSERYASLAGGVMPNIGWEAFGNVLRRKLEAHGVRWVTVDGAVETSITETSDTETNNTGATGGRVCVESGSQRVQADVLITPASDATQARRTEMTFVHAETADVPGSLDRTLMTEMYSDLTGMAAGWSRRTIVLPGRECVTELRSPVMPAGQEADIDAVIEAAGFAVTDVRELRVTHARPFPATEVAESDERDLRSRDATVIDSHVLSSERGLATVIGLNIDRARVLRREILGLA